MSAGFAHDEALAAMAPGVLAHEGQRNRRVGWVAVAAVGASFAALLVLVGSAPPGSDGSVSVRALQQAGQDPGLLWAAVGLRAVGLVMTAVVCVHLVALIAAREQTPRTMRVLAVVAPLVIAAVAIASNVALMDSAQAFGGHGAQTERRAQDLLTDTGVQRVTSVAAIAAAFMFSVWLGWASLAAARVGLLTRFLGYFGVGGALASAFLPVAGHGLILGWLGSVGILLLGWWPGGRGPAWTTGRVAPWNAGAEDRKPPRMIP